MDFQDFQNQTVMIIGYPCPVDADYVVIPLRHGWTPVNFLRMAFGVSVIWKKDMDTKRVNKSREWKHGGKRV
jgi:hypothetical protein